MLHHIVFSNLGEEFGERRDNTCTSFTSLDSQTKLPGFAERGDRTTGASAWRSPALGGRRDLRMPLAGRRASRVPDAANSPATRGRGRGARNGRDHGRSASGAARDLDLPPERYTVTIRGLDAARAAVRAFDPLTNREVPATAEAGEGDALRVTLEAVDYPRVLVLSEK